MKSSQLLFCIATLLLSGSALAQTDTGIRSVEITNRAGMVAGSVTVRGPGLQLMRPLVGEPYSAEQVSQHSQTLADGTHILQKRTVARMYRDSRGRTRNERMFYPRPGKAKQEAVATLVHIYDPVAGYAYTLDLQRHIAHRIAMELPPVKAGVNGAPRRAREHNPAHLELPSLSKVRQGHEVTSESLGTKMIEGISVEGTRITITTPAGAEGNDRPMQRVCDRWHSEELNLTLLSNCSDPRSGRVILRLSNLNRGEPDPALFEIPADYTMVDEKEKFTVPFGETDAAGAVP
jgi:hypothetical protein